MTLLLLGGWATMRKSQWADYHHRSWEGRASCLIWDPSSLVSIAHHHSHISQHNAVYIGLLLATLNKGIFIVDANSCISDYFSDQYQPSYNPTTIQFYIWKSDICWFLHGVPTKLAVSTIFWHVSKKVVGRVAQSWLCITRQQIKARRRVLLKLATRDFENFYDLPLLPALSLISAILACTED